MVNNKKICAAVLLILVISLSLGRGFIPSYAYAFWTTEDSEEKNMEVLLRGYNVFSGTEISANNTFAENAYIIDKNNEEYIKHISKREIVNSSSKYLCDDNLFGIEKEYSKSIGQDLFGNIYIVDTGLQNQFNTSSTLKNIVREKYELYSLENCRYSYISDLDVDDIKKYLSSNFKEDLYAIDSLGKAEALYKKYGTHLLTGAIYGGRMNITSYMATNSENTHIEDGMSLQRKLEGVMIGHLSGTEFSDIYELTENSDSWKSNYSITLYGGATTSIMSIDTMFSSRETLNLSEKPSRPFDEWQESINKGENLIMISIPNGAKAIPVWDLIDENEENSYKIRQLLIESYLKLCNKNYKDFMETNGYDEDLKTITKMEIDGNLSSIEFLDKIFEVGESINIKDLEGLAVRITYSDGTNILTDNIAKEENLELIDPVVGQDGFMILSAKDYSCYINLNLPTSKGEKDENTIPTQEPKIEVNNDYKDESNITNTETVATHEPTTVIQEEDRNIMADNEIPTLTWFLIIIILVLLIIVFILIRKGSLKNRNE